MFGLAHKQCNGIIEGWLRCHTSESKGRFLVNNILFGTAWCVVMTEIQFSLIKQITIEPPEHLLTSHPLHRITSHFCLTPHPTPPHLPPTPPQSGRHMCITLKWISKVEKLDVWKELFRANFVRKFQFRPVHYLILAKQKWFFNILIRRLYFENLNDGTMA